MRAVLCGVAVMGLTALLAGCSSYQSQHVIVDEFGIAKGAKFEGIPISVTAAQKVAFVETISTYELLETTFDAEGTAIETKVVDTFRRRTIDPTPIPLGRSEIFTIDAKRPISGTGKSSITLDKDKQYPTLVSNDVSDNTLSTLTAAAEKLADKFTAQAATVDSPRSERLVSQEQHFLVYDPETGKLQRLD